MALDPRLACLMIAIKEEWDELEAVEENGALLIRIRDMAKMDSWEAIRKFGRLNKQRTLLPQTSD
ncbi:MAG: hypothetical protein M1530_01095 [Candidatus Marsarchaeota archaeon]|nr:hypothetical protein [Candidatus Marsarchaeota archaeon]